MDVKQEIIIQLVKNNVPLECLRSVEEFVKDKTKPSSYYEGYIMAPITVISPSKKIWGNDDKDGNMYSMYMKVYKSRKENKWIVEKNSEDSFENRFSELFKNQLLLVITPYTKSSDVINYIKDNEKEIDTLLITDDFHDRQWSSEKLMKRVAPLIKDEKLEVDRILIKSRNKKPPTKYDQIRDEIDEKMNIWIDTPNLRKRYSEIKNKKM